jgi:hypothetical protein
VTLATQRLGCDHCIVITPSTLERCDLEQTAAELPPLTLWPLASFLAMF